VTTWKDSLTSAASSLQGGGISADALKSAAGDVEDATETLADDLKGLGRPDTEAGQQAQKTIETLADQLSDGADTIEDAVDDVSGLQGVVAAVSTVTKTLTTMGTQVASAFSELEGLEGGQELKDAFSEADSCSSLTSGS
jgi:methyl-accepting chemotaxis protein